MWKRVIATLVVLLILLGLEAAVFASWSPKADAATYWQKVYENGDANTVYALAEWVFIGV